jgi:hypothetical protein
LPDNWRTYIEYACRLYFRIWFHGS